MTPADPITLVIITDHAGFRAALVELLAGDPAIRVVGQGASATEALELVQQWQPNLVLLDVRIPGGSAIAAQTIHTTWPRTRVVFLTASSREEDFRMAQQVGAHGYLLKGDGLSDLVAGLRAVQAGEWYVSPTLQAALTPGANETLSGSGYLWSGPE